MARTKRSRLLQVEDSQPAASLLDQLKEVLDSNQATERDLKKQKADLVS